MAGGAVKPPGLSGPSAWVFPWRPVKQPLFPKFLAFAIPAVLFTFLVTTVRIHVNSPERSSIRKGSVIYLGDDAQGRALTLRAREGGPFPSRFELSQWQGLRDLETAAMDASRFQPPAYAPALQELPGGNLSPPLELAAKGVPFFPDRDPSVFDIPDLGNLTVVPVLYPLAGVTGENLPKDLPPLAMEVKNDLPTATWRFLIRLNADGSVAECVSLEKGAETSATGLAAWLHKVTFAPDLSKLSRWIGVGIGFTNQPADGTDTH